MKYKFIADVWLYPGNGAWHFVSVPKEHYEELKEIGGNSRGFGSIRVRATTGETSWNTSIFPDSKTKTFLLPIKKSVRVAENLHEGSKVNLILELKDI